MNSMRIVCVFRKNNQFLRNRYKTDKIFTLCKVFSPHQRYPPHPPSEVLLQCHALPIRWQSSAKALAAHCHSDGSGLPQLWQNPYYSLFIFLPRNEQADDFRVVLLSATNLVAFQVEVVHPILRLTHERTIQADPMDAVALV